MQRGHTHPDQHSTCFAGSDLQSAGNTIRRLRLAAVVDRKESRFSTNLRDFVKTTPRASTVDDAPSRSGDAASDKSFSDRSA